MRDVNIIILCDIFVNHKTEILLKFMLFLKINVKYLIYIGTVTNLLLVIEVVKWYNVGVELCRFKTRGCFWWNIIT